MAKKIEELWAKMSPERRAKSEALARQMIAEMPLHQIRRARQLTQETLARNLNLRQSEVSKIEKRTDMYVSTLASYIKAMGGELEIRAVFPDSVTRITQFEEPGS